MQNLHDEETRVTDAKSGGQKGKKLTQVGALDPVALILMGRVAGIGANKYAAFNFLKGYDWSLSFNAMLRHAFLFWAGEDYDPETGLPHMAMSAWHGHTLTGFLERHIGNDDRPPTAFPKDVKADVKQDGDFDYDEIGRLMVAYWSAPIGDDIQEWARIMDALPKVAGRDSI